MRTILQKPFYSHLINGLFLLIIFLSPAKVPAQATDVSIFRDDFDRNILGSGWQTNNWFIINGSAYNGYGGPLKTTVSYDQTSYVIETAARGFTNNYYREFRITFGQADLFNDSAYVLRYTEYNGGRLTLGRSTNNIFYPELLDEVAIYPDFDDIQWYKFKIARYESGLIQVYVDKGLGYETTPLLEAIDQAYPTLGHFGWTEDTQTYPIGFYVDWIEAVSPGTQKPAVREKPVEDNLITQVSATSGRSYKVAKLNVGVEAYTDRSYTITSLPSYLEGASFIQTAMDDKFDASDIFLTSFIKKEAVVYVAYDPRISARPAWLDGWTKTGDSIGLTDPGAGYLEIYSRLIQWGEIYPYPLFLGGNFASPAQDAKMNYIVAAVERPRLLPLQAEDAELNGAVVATNHLGYNGTGFVDYKDSTDDYIEWTVQIDVPGTYNLGFRYAHAGLTDRALQITDNGADVALISFSPVWWSWDSWGFLSGPNVFLTSGIHKIRATATGMSGPNMDELNLYYYSSAPPVITSNKNYQGAGVASVPPDQIYKAYPNPFRQSTTIYYELKEKAQVNLSIWSLQGQQLQLLVNGMREPGNYHATFDANKLSAGIYFYRLQIGNQVKLGKLLKE
jgi:hypothetical protein